MHPELHGALSSALAYGDISQGRIIEAHTTTAWRWVKTAVKRAEELGAISPGKRVSTHTLRHSYAPTPSDERHSHQLPVSLAGALFDTDYAHLPGACAGPDGQPCDGAVMECKMMTIDKTVYIETSVVSHLTARLAAAPALR